MLRLFIGDNIQRQEKGIMIRYVLSLAVKSVPELFKGALFYS